MCFLTAVTRILGIARFLCEYCGPLWRLFSQIRIDVAEKCCLFQEGGHLGPNLPPPHPVLPYFSPPVSIQRRQLLTGSAVFSKKEVTLGQICLLWTKFCAISPLPSAFNDINCWREMLSLPRRRSPRAKSDSFGPSLAPFLPFRQHSATPSSRIYENRTIRLLEPTHRKGAVSGQSNSFCFILPITRPQSLWNLK